ncbi:hypothetical protein BESB_069130 [Besnoitia besnoiti]|uniref:Nucleolar 12, 25 kDa protein n=1 Tax=Besnoitia besnoiti TaxID=94643 RepID=A0A2A9MHI4_BESBE|nr:hypothetical protein BESB_069130 [Besnoitia besnoiti]PFH34880.1 hypothetical protein BESB_069130 [Besnoitia besnoiti]
MPPEQDRRKGKERPQKGEVTQAPRGGFKRRARFVSFPRSSLPSNTDVAKMKPRRPGKRSCQRGLEISFDPKKQREFIDGFAKRKAQRRQAAAEQAAQREKEERRRLKREKQELMMKHLADLDEARKNAALAHARAPLRRKGKSLSEKENVQRWIRRTRVSYRLSCTRRDWRRRHSRALAREDSLIESELSSSCAAEHEPAPTSREEKRKKGDKNETSKRKKRTEREGDARESARPARKAKFEKKGRDALAEGGEGGEGGIEREASSRKADAAASQKRFQSVVEFLPSASPDASVADCERSPSSREAHDASLAPWLLGSVVTTSIGAFLDSFEATREGTAAGDAAASAASAGGELARVQPRSTTAEASAAHGAAGPPACGRALEKKAGRRAAKADAKTASAKKAKKKGKSRTQTKRGKGKRGKRPKKGRGRA